MTASLAPILLTVDGNSEVSRSLARDLRQQYGQEGSASSSHRAARRRCDHQHTDVRRNLNGSLLHMRKNLAVGKIELDDGSCPAAVDGRGDPSDGQLLEPDRLAHQDRRHSAGRDDSVDDEDVIDATGNAVGLARPSVL